MKSRDLKKIEQVYRFTPASLVFTKVRPKRDNPSETTILFCQYRPELTLHLKYSPFPSISLLSMLSYCNGIASVPAPVPSLIPATLRTSTTRAALPKPLPHQMILLRIRSKAVLIVGRVFLAVMILLDSKSFVFWGKTTFEVKLPSGEHAVAKRCNSYDC